MKQVKLRRQNKQTSTPGSNKRSDYNLYTYIGRTEYQVEVVSRWKLFGLKSGERLDKATWLFPHSLCSSWLDPEKLDYWEQSSTVAFFVCPLLVLMLPTINPYYFLAVFMFNTSNID